METKKSPESDLKEDNGRTFAVRSLKARADARRSVVEKLADGLTSFFGTITFLLLNAICFAAWIAINTGMVPGIEIFDPFPFVLLTTIVSIEAIFLAIIVLISQNREARIADVREEIDLHINRVAEAEITQIIKMLAMVLKKQGFDVKNDPDIKRMLRPTSAADIERKVEAQTNHKNEVWNQLASTALVKSKVKRKPDNKTQKP